MISIKVIAKIYKVKLLLGFILLIDSIAINIGKLNIQRGSLALKMA
jgi:hypothetical protein